MLPSAQFQYRRLVSHKFTPTSDVPFIRDADRGVPRKVAPSLASPEPPAAPLMQFVPERGPTVIRPGDAFRRRFSRPRTSKADLNISVHVHGYVIRSHASDRTGTPWPHNGQAARASSRPPERAFAAETMQHTPRQLLVVRTISAAVATPRDTTGSDDDHARRSLADAKNSDPW
jgi:hypothetical protein